MPQFALLMILVLLPLQMLSGGVTPRESMPEFVQQIMLAAPTTHFVMLAQGILFRGGGHRRGLAAVPRPRRDRRGPLRHRAGALPQDHRADGLTWLELRSLTNTKMKNGGTNSRHRVVIIGCGFGGLFAAKALRHAAVDVTVIDRTNHHLFQPLLYQVATGILSSGDIAPAIREILRHQRNTSVVFGEVVDVDLNSRRVVVDTVGRRDVVAYDSLIVAAGAEQYYFGNDHFATLRRG